MTPEDKALISDYMGWKWCRLRERYTRILNGEREVIHWDLNDAGLCVEKMVEKGDWSPFLSHILKHFKTNEIQAYIIAWLFNSDNFFGAMAAWLRGK